MRIIGPPTATCQATVKKASDDRIVADVVLDLAGFGKIEIRSCFVRLRPYTKLALPGVPPKPGGDSRWHRLVVLPMHLHRLVLDAILDEAGL